MIPVDEVKATVESPDCDELAKRSPGILLQQLRKIQYPKSDKNQNDWEWAKATFKVDYLYLTGWQDGWRGGGVESKDRYRYLGTNADLVRGQIAGRAAFKACYDHRSDESGGIREGS